MSHAVQSNQRCPNCKAEIAAEKNEVPWCESCNWNVDPYQGEKYESVFDEFLNSLGRLLSEGIYQSVQSKESIYPRWTKEKIFTISLCVFIIALPVCLLVFSLSGYYFLPKLFFYLFLILSIGFAYLSYSKWFKKPEYLVERSQFPVFYELVDQICMGVGGYQISGVGLVPEFGAFYTERGWGPFKKRYICLGLPLVEIVSSEELVALIAHEASHGANGDLMRLSIMHRALHILSESFYVFSPQHSKEGTNSRDASFLMVILSNYLFYGISQIPFACWKLMRRLAMRDSQEAEYYADLLATKVCGKRAMISMLKKLRYFDEYDLAVGKLALEKDKYNFFEELKKLTIAEKSKRTLARMDRLEELRGLSLDSTHPPLVYRIALIEMKGNEMASVRIDPNQYRKSREELERVKSKAVEELMDSRLRVLYGYGEG